MSLAKEPWTWTDGAVLLLQAMLLAESNDTVPGRKHFPLSKKKDGEDEGEFQCYKRNPTKKIVVREQTHQS